MGSGGGRATGYVLPLFFLSSSVGVPAKKSAVKNRNWLKSKLTHERKRMNKAQKEYLQQKTTWITRSITDVDESKLESTESLYWRIKSLEDVVGALVYDLSKKKWWQFWKLD